ncbi:hypothetical protein [Youngiibacter fragilis]|uniref:Uncharacterized protein n=1 Tax=Youngiibacter fragilis 232.1 TaxID=994573 RepID=V7I405_9CLOT|nr:hypothetical protein [Youngiibacter fragilis]ETA80036.1 hypothetical protein T472_0213910 [Youngiibacter fragilis 232.1]
MDSWKRKASAAIEIYAVFLLLFSGGRLMAAYGELPESIGDYGISIIRVYAAGKGILVTAYGISIILFAALTFYGRVRRKEEFHLSAAKLLTASVLPLINERIVKSLIGASGIHAYLEGFLGWTAILVLAAILSASIFRMYFRKV